MLDRIGKLPKANVLNRLRPWSPWARKIMGPKAYRRLGEVLSATPRYDEVECVYRALRNVGSGSRYMIDVGGHHGESFEPFASDGWRVDCFEPNPANHKAINARIAATGGHVRLFSQAVADVPKQNLPFYLSDQSSGISSLHAFHESHHEGLRVDTIALRDHLAERGNPSIDILKIDTEGFDFFVLKGIDWEVVSPRVIVCEFEDLKTKDLGYTYRDMAQYLLDRGYEVFVSEWHPVEAYGQTHKWRCYKRFPCELATPEAWGNLIAVLPGPTAEAVKNELRRIGEIA